jgi:hypothetical protein
MKKIFLLPCILLLVLAFFSISAIAQSNCTVLQNNPSAIRSESSNLSLLSGFMELPFLLISVFFAFATAQALKGGKFGKGMNMLAWGFVVMAVGHLHMQVEHIYGYNLFNHLFGQIGGTVAWFVALMITWGFSGLGFYSILKASKGK